MTLVTWIPVLVNGRTGDWVVRWIGGFYRWFDRVYGYALLLTGTYPPFRLDDWTRQADGTTAAVLGGWVASRNVSGASAPRDSASTTASSPGSRRKSALGLTNAWPPRLIESSVAR